MNYRIQLIISFIIATVLYSCDKINYYPDKDFKEVKTLILAHKTGGSDTSQYLENTLYAAKHSLAIVDGIECDLQLSKDKTVWLSHSVDLPDCGGVSYKCFPEATNSQIKTLDSCNGNTVTYNKLEEIFEYMSSNYPEKYISLDVKTWSPCAVTSSDVLGLMNVIADEIIRLTAKYNLQDHVMVESETATFLNYMKNHSSGIECYLTSFGDFERAMQLSLEAGYAGISFKYKSGEDISRESIQLIRKKGLKIQLWTVDDVNYIQEALSINPDFIQTDNLGYFENSCPNSKIR
jgi:glycerophosphoryl diester phosphodiesterase